MLQYLTSGRLTLIPLYRDWVRGAKTLYKVVRKYLSENGLRLLCSWLLTQCWFLYFSIYFSIRTSMFFYIFLEHAAVAVTVLHAPYNNLLTETAHSRHCHTAYSMFQSVRSSNTKTLFSIHLHDFSRGKSGLIGLLCFFLKFKVLKIKEKINSTEASCSLHCCSP